MNFVQVNFKITGLEPGMLTNNPAKMGQSSQGAKTKKIPSPEEEAEAGLYKDAEGNYCFPTMGFRASLLNVLSNKKVGKKAANVVFSAAVFVEDEYVILRDPKTWKPLKDYDIDSRRCVVQRNGVIRSRPKFPRWGCDLIFKVDTDLVSEDQAFEQLSEAGQVIGVGDFRPARKGMFGRYLVERK